MRDLDSKGNPTHKKLWVWESKWDPSYENSASAEERKKEMSYLLMDGPGEKANCVGWESEENLENWTPAEDEPLIDLS